MKILAVDQARHGAWAVYDYEGKKLLDYGAWGFDNKNYTFEQAILHIEALPSRRSLTFMGIFCISVDFTIIWRYSHGNIP